jgi:hypothetical protein
MNSACDLVVNNICKCSQHLCPRKALNDSEERGDLCRVCYTIFTAEDNGDVCVLCGRNEYIMLDSPINYVPDVPLEFIKCNHWACADCWSERFSQENFLCHTCDQDVFVLMQRDYDTAGTVPPWPATDSSYDEESDNESQEECEGESDTESLDLDTADKECTSPSNQLKDTAAKICCSSK